jgi:LuxR family maltose regulon positive regulatory protein
MVQSTFSTTLNRLRKLIGHKEALQLQNGKLSIDQKYCWMDTWAFSNILNEADDLWEKGKETEAVDLYEKGLSFYRGHFLADDGGKPWIILTRERLKNVFLATIVKLGRWHEQKQKYEKAITCYDKGLSIDYLEEVLYQRLMVCHHCLGRYADAVRIYQRCRDTLTTVLGGDPSLATEELYKRIKPRRT